MDPKATTEASGGEWTEERHASYLNWMEESFVERMLSNSPKCSGGDWTEERHASYVNLMEESFVERMLCNSPKTSGGRRPPRLDRHLPESATASTQRSSVPAIPAADAAKIVISDRTMAGSRRRYDASHDQVVPLPGGQEMHGG